MKRLSDHVCVGGNHFITLFFTFEGGKRTKACQYVETTHQVLRVPPM